MMDIIQSVESENALNSGSGITQKKPKGIVSFDNEGVMWYREPHETTLSEFTKMNINCCGGLNLIRNRASHLARGHP